jgi:putative holliday junction resolvase
MHGEPSGTSESPSTPGRVMALDLGNRRIGIALTDPLGSTAQPLMTLYCKSPRADLKSIARLIRKHQVTEAVVGKPLHMSGEPSPRAAGADEFAAQLREMTGIPVHLCDERLTSWDAHQLLDQVSGPRRTAADRQERKRVIDQVAAVLILESFLEARKIRVAEQE